MENNGLDFDLQCSRIAYPTITQSPYQALNHRFCVIGNGYGWAKDKKTGEMFEATCGDIKGSVAAQVLRTGVDPYWPLEPNVTFGEGVLNYRKQDIIPLVNGRATWDHIRKPKSWYPLSNYSLISELAQGASPYTGKIENSRKDLIEGALVVTDLLLERALTEPEPDKKYIIDIHDAHKTNLNNARLAGLWKKKIINHWHGENIRTYLLEFTEEDYKQSEDFAPTFVNVMSRAIATNKSVYGNNKCHYLTNKQALWLPGEDIDDLTWYASVPDELLVEVAEKRPTTWLMFFYDEHMFSKEEIKLMTDTVRIPYLSNMVVKPTTTYVAQTAYDMISGFEHEDWYRIWKHLTPEEREANCKYWREVYISTQVLYDRDGRRMVPWDEYDSAKLFVPDPEPLIVEQERRAGLTQEERDAEDEARQEHLREVFRDLFLKEE